MARWRYILITLVCLFALNVASLAQERFPPPEFETDYVRPTTTMPQPEQDIWEYVAAGVLIGALLLAAHLALKRRSRKAIFALMLFSLVAFGFIRKGCVCTVGSVQNVALTAFDPAYAIPIVVLIFFAAPLVVTLFFGRVFCGAVCPLGAIQDAVLIHPVRVPNWLESSLRLLAYVYLGAGVLFAALGAAFIICQYDPFVGFFRLGGNWNILVLGACLLLIGLFVGRPYCRFLCPYGVILRQFSRLSKWRVTITPNDCIKCRLCEDACPFGAIRAPTEPWPGKEYKIAKVRLAFLLLLFPMLVAGGAWGGYLLRDSFARMHPQVRLAERVHLEESGEVEGTTDASDAFRTTGRPSRELYDEAAQIGRRFAIGGAIFGGFVGFIIGGKLLALAVRRRRSDYEADRASCFACGRCYEYCPKEHERLKLGEKAVVART
ncbi:MAG: 4Fe-4S binding protein [Sedimentisphaerales bacterium]|nr:4Fe-4S binding protein [Sedimentisphaerales bacterium]